ncbi:ATP-dependent helicase/deoxyribonuclease subunit B [Labeo rohita]|uniref:ATP-dependent helicase/deoxyribonuclease subunit B n=1 Tax=Labeo rohita TaxID=84645 RepID=A0ABQ8N0M9_LABRO|nr:ATP-dependent helicase/deoxyribonuclease subunit B [Labeo rohita]
MRFFHPLYLLLLLLTVLFITSAEKQVHSPKNCFFFHLSLSRFSQPEAEISQTELSKETLSTSSLQSAIPLRFHNYVAILMMPAENQRAAMDGK